MGALAGHMSHLYDNPRLTFSKLKEIFVEAAMGNLEGTEKTDGQNLYLSFSVPNQKLDFTETDDGPGRAARNKGNIKSGGLTVRQVVSKFDDHPNQKLKKSFSHALHAFENVIKSFPREKQIEIFGPDTDIYYNAEIINPETPNVINYDNKLVTLHRGGGGYFDKETGGEKEFETRDPESGELVAGPRDVSGNAEILAASLEDVIQDMESNKGFKVIMDAIFKLKAIDNREDLQKAISGINSETSSEGISENQMIIEYVIARIGTLLKQSGIQLDSSTESLVIKRLILLSAPYKKAYGYDKMPKELAPAKILKDLPARDKNKVLYIFKNHKDILKQAIQPIEHIVHDFSVSMLEGLESLFILDNKKGIEKIKEKVRAAKEKIEKEGIATNIKILLQQMEKLKSIETISTAAEGFVFDYDGYTYKFTGNFAPINQILGIGKYDGRGTLPSLDAVKTHRVPRETGLAAKGRMKFEGQNLVHEVLNILIPEKKSTNRYVVLIPGGFKPPHKGHYAMFENYAKMPNVEAVVVLWGEKGRGGMSKDKAHQLFELYGGLNDKVQFVDHDRPFTAAFKVLGDPKFVSQFGEDTTFALGCGAKGDDEARAANFAKWFDEHPDQNPLGVSVEDLGACPAEMTDSGDVLSASRMREAAEKGDDETLALHVPEGVDLESVKNIILSGEDSESLEEMIYEMIEDLINEVSTEKQRNWACSQIDNPDELTVKQAKEMCSSEIKEEEELEEISAAGGGAVSGGAGLESPGDDHPRLKGAIRGIKITYERQV